MVRVGRFLKFNVAIKGFEFLILKRPNLIFADLRFADVKDENDFPISEKGPKFYFYFFFADLQFWFLNCPIFFHKVNSDRSLTAAFRTACYKNLDNFIQVTVSKDNLRKP